jgi:death-on-curing protein
MNDILTTDCLAREQKTKARLNYFGVEYAIKEHNFIIEHSGGLSGVRDLGMIESVLEHIKNDEYYPDFLDKLTHIVYGFNKNHVFHDGNKRTSLALSAFFWK